MNIFYLICPIGLEKAVYSELERKNLLEGIASIKTTPGGLEIECPLEYGLALNTQLRTVTRILLRIKERRCRDFPKLFNIVAKIPWRDFLVQESAQWKISSKQSRIIHTDKARESCEKALKKYFAGAPLSKKTIEQYKTSAPQKIYLRLDNDNLTISLDTSGELLHIRGGRPDRGKASLRESYAACLLTLLYMNDPHEAPRPLVDPMCGTGTFLNEALDYYSPMQRQDFPFHTWKSVSVATKTLPTDKKLVSGCVGMDLEPKAQEREALEILTQDFFKPFTPELMEKLKGALLICNPPYGKRVKIEGERKEYFRSFIRKIETELRPLRYGIIIPADVKIPLKEFQVYPFNNNGIKVNFCVKALN